ncbi:MAG: hypothetical protein ACRDLP_15840 [Solirubrobacteraceae bacterium]
MVALATTAAGADATPTASLRSLAARYVAIAEAGNRRLEKDFDPLEGRDRNNLPRARADLLDAAATEQLFDRRLLAIAFPPAIERLARELYSVNQRRAALTIGAAASTSVSAVHTYEPVLDAANGPVERWVDALRHALGLPPASTS